MYNFPHFRKGSRSYKVFTANYIMTWHDSSSSSIADYLNQLSSASPIPGGGSVSALLGAIGFSLGNMVANLTKEQTSNLEVKSEMQLITEQLNTIIQDFLLLMKQDEVAFLPLSKAYYLPQHFPDREDIMEEALKNAASVPYHVLSLLGSTIDIFERIYLLNISHATSDIGIGVSICKASFESSILNITVNTKFMKNKSYAKELNTMAKEICLTGISKCICLYDKILAENLDLF